MDWFPTLDPLSPMALAIAHLFMALLFIMAGVFLIVAIWLIVNIIKFRARDGGPRPSQNYGIAKLEIAWTVAPILLLAVLFGITLQTAGYADPPIFAADATAAVRQQIANPDIIVIGHQWYWEFRYAGVGVYTANEMHIPVGKRLRVELLSADVIHSFWIPQLNGKRDAIPGQINGMWIEADKAGVYDGACAEFCGDDHAWMRFKVVAQPPAQFAAWLQHLAQPAAIPTSGDAALGYQFFMNGACRNCHAIAGTPAGADIGPNLTHFASRSIIAGGVLTNTPQNLEQWLTNPQRVKPGNHMPDFGFDQQQVAILTAYLETLK